MRIFVAHSSPAGGGNASPKPLKQPRLNTNEEEEDARLSINQHGEYSVCQGEERKE